MMAVFIRKVVMKRCVKGRCFVCRIKGFGDRLGI